MTIEDLELQLKDIEYAFKDLENENDRIKSECEELEANQRPNWLNVEINESMLIGSDIDNLNQLILDYCEKHNISTTRGNW